MKTVYRFVRTATKWFSGAIVPTAIESNTAAHEYSVKSLTVPVPAVVLPPIMGVPFIFTPLGI